MTRKRTHRVARAQYHPFIVARNHATLLTDEERQSVITPLTQAAQRMRQGLASDDDWAMLSGSLMVAQAIESQGVVRGLAGHLAEIDRALVAIEARASRTGTWRSPTLHYNEIEAVQLLLDLHGFQLQQVSYGEFKRARDKTEAQVRSRRGQLVRQVDGGWA